MATRDELEDFFVTGEGIFAADDASDDSRATPRRPTTLEELRKSRFARMCPSAGARASRDLMERLAGARVAGSRRPDSVIPAGFTYLGQFVDHDLTFDKTARFPGEQITVAELAQDRSPSLDLDSLYGRGPADEPEIYADGVRLQTGATIGAQFPAGNDAARRDLEGFDLPRVGHGSTRAERRRARIPDLRNDRSLPLAQTHAAFLRFHNRMVDVLAPLHARASLFEIARAEVTKHYQWVLLHDFLPRIVDQNVLHDVFRSGWRHLDPSPRGELSSAAGRTRTSPPDPVGALPIEFAMAAYRLGPSMVRASYEWNAVFQTGGPGPAATLALLLNFGGVRGTLSPDADLDRFDEPNKGSFERLPTSWIVDWRRLYDLATDAERADLAAPRGKLNFARPIHTLLANPLSPLPPGAFSGLRDHFLTEGQRNLAFRDLERGSMVALASGQELAALFDEPTLSPSEILEGSGGATPALTDAQKGALVRSTPLWFYVLREAEVRGSGRLGKVGSRIVAETFHRAIQASVHSVLRQPTWRPSRGPDRETFRMAHLLLFAFEDQHELLNPLG